VSKKIRKSTKKSIGGAAAEEVFGACAGCSRPLRLGNRKCKCGKVNPNHLAGKSVRPGVFKAAGGHLVDIHWKCLSKHPNLPGDEACTVCGEPRNIPPAAFSGWLQKAVRAQYPETRNPNGAA
jgi:hypothetical protein